MRLIREMRDISRETLHTRTKIALENIELFEQGELEQHPHFNDVYLRALVRAYADVLDISTERALQALEKARAGTYGGELGDAYLDRETTAPDEAKDVDEDAGAGEQVRNEVVDDETSNRRESDTSSEAPPSSPADREESVDSGPAAEKAQRPAPYAGGTMREQPRDSSTQPSTTARASRGGVSDWLATGGMGTVILGGAIVILIGLAVWAFTTLFSGGAAQIPEETSSAGAADTTGESTRVVEQRPPVATIGDSLDFTIIAADDKLEPVRISLDGGSWNPYWIEQGDSLSLTARDAFTVRDYLSRARLRVETLEWPLDGLGRYDTVRVSRQLVQQRIDSISAARVP